MSTDDGTAAAAAINAATSKNDKSRKRRAANEKGHCPTCFSDDPEKMLNPDCRNSFHPVQMMELPPEAQHLTETCGPHCGVKDEMVSHCDCEFCHNGNRKKEGLKKLAHIGGKSVKGVKPE